MINKAKAAGKLINGIAYLSPSRAGKITLDLFCRPIEGREFNKKEMTFLKKAKWSSLKLDGKKIQCYTWGTEGQKVLLAHGFNSNASRWRPLVNLLQKSGYQVIALDIPAHGHSDGRRINGLLYARVIEQVMQQFQPSFVIGHSFAGIAFAYYFSIMKALTVEKIILLGVPNELSDIADVFFQQVGLNEKVQAAYYRTFEEKFGYPTTFFTLSKLLKEVPYPSLIIHDENDDIASFAGAKQIHELWEGSTFFPTKNLGHSLQGRSVYKAILEFLKQKNG